jgi:hypothetical protein
MRSILRVISLLLLGIWLGAAIFFSAAVAPSVFAVLRGAGLANANALAGSVVTRLLTIINQGGFEIALFVLIISYFILRDRNRLARFAGMISLAIMAIMTGLGHWVIGVRLAALRAAMQLPIDQIALQDPRRMEFDSLHRYSVAALSIAMIAGLVGFVIMSGRRGSNTAPGE